MLTRETIRLFEDLAATRQYAKSKHDATGATRKHSGDPYWVHPQGVSDLLKAYGASELEQEIAFCHDLLEDCEITWDELRKIAGEEVADYVSEITNSKEEIKKIGKQLYLDKELLTLSSPARTVKIADCLYNYLDYPTKDQKERILHHVDFIKRNLKLTKVQKELIEAFI